MLEDFLTNELAFAIAIGGEPHPLGRSQRIANGFELGGFIAAFSRASVVKAIGAQEYWGPALPCRDDILRFEQVKQMSFGREEPPHSENQQRRERLSPGWISP